MIVASTLARILLGLLFAFGGIAPFVFGSPPPQPGLPGAVNHALFASHWILFVAFVQLFIGISFLSNRFVPVAYHLATSPTVLPLWFAGTVLWLLVALPYRALFAPIFAAKPPPVTSPRTSVTKRPTSLVCRS